MTMIRGRALLRQKGVMSTQERVGVDGARGWGTLEGCGRKGGDVGET